MLSAQILLACLAILGQAISIHREVRRVSGPVILKQQTAADATFGIIFVMFLSWTAYICAGSFDKIIGWPN